MNLDQLQSELRAGITDISVERLGASSFRVVLPGFRTQHDSVAIGVTEHDEGWTLSDGGQLAYLMDDDFDKVIAAMECAGAVFSPTGYNSVGLEVSHGESLCTSIISFSHYLSAAPVVWHSLECAKGAQDQKPSTIDVMATETKNRLVKGIGRATAQYLQLKHTVNDRGESMKAPLAVASPRMRRRPPLLTTFIDMTAAPQAVISAKKNAAYLWEVVRDWETRKYVVVRGGSPDHFSDFYDNYNITAVSSEDLGTLQRDTEEAIGELVGV
jgi:hypothetical protein